jgi:formylglycine-generating enzyme required for sulfatase activity
MSSAIMLALNLRPADRFQSVGEMRRALMGGAFDLVTKMPAAKWSVQFQQMLQQPPTDATRPDYIKLLEELLEDSDVQGGSSASLRAGIRNELHKQWQEYGFYWQGKQNSRRAQQAFENGLKYQPECMKCRHELEKQPQPFLHSISNQVKSILVLVILSTIFILGYMIYFNGSSSDYAGEETNIGKNQQSKGKGSQNKAPQSPGRQQTSTSDAVAMRNEVIQRLHKNMVYIKGGYFNMGCTREHGGDCRMDERPAHLVHLDDFYMNKFEVTRDEWHAIMGIKDGQTYECLRCPMGNLSRDNAVAFINKLNSLSGKKYRLPTEAEWEFAARGGLKSKGFKFSGSNSLDSVGWYEMNAGDLVHEVGRKSPNELGLYDMSGNVYEWCSDWYGENYYKYGITENPKGPELASFRILRGGCFRHSASECRVAKRGTYNGSKSQETFGFRLASN